MKPTSIITRLMIAFGTTMLAFAVAPPCLGQAKPDGRQLDKQWAQFRGLNGSGVNKQAPPAQFGPDKNVRWKISTPVGHSSPIIWSNHIFLTGYEPESKTLLALAYHARTGKLLWKRNIPASGIEKTHKVSNPATSTRLRTANAFITTLLQPASLSSSSTERRFGTSHSQP
ncbi:MAG: hypothetical protein IPJ07_16900 [Acidobacteria bacterium]|nr:hypothetical protein [Acidobacteriota bacterium]